MKLRPTIRVALAAGALAVGFAAPAGAQVAITEVAPYASGNTAYGADWFEITNFGPTAIDLTNWRVDDNSNSFAASVALRGIGLLGAGQSAVFLEGGSSNSGDAALDAAFLAAWFGSSVPTGLLVGNYGGSGVGLSTSGDAVNLYNAGGTLVAGISFGNSTAGRSFDNSGGANGAVAQLSSVGTHGAFTSFDGAEIASPFLVSAVPEPSSMAMLFAGVGLLAWMRRRSASPAR